LALIDIQIIGWIQRNFDYATFGSIHVGKILKGSRKSKISLIEVTQFWMDQEVTSKLSHIIVSGVLYGHDSNDHRVMEKEPF